MSNIRMTEEKARRLLHNKEWKAKEGWVPVADLVDRHLINIWNLFQKAGEIYRMRSIREPDLSTKERKKIDNATLTELALMVHPEAQVILLELEDRGINLGGRILDERTDMYEFDGQRKPIEEWAKEAGISPTTLRRRLKRGMPFGEALTATTMPKELRKPAGKTITADGKTQTIRQWAADLGITSQALRLRLKRMTPEEAVTMKRQDNCDTRSKGKKKKAPKPKKNLLQRVREAEAKKKAEEEEVATAVNLDKTRFSFEIESNKAGSLIEILKALGVEKIDIKLS